MVGPLRTLWDNYFRLPQFLVNGVALPVRQVVNLIGSAVDNPTEERTDITLGGGAAPGGSEGAVQTNNGAGGFGAVAPGASGNVLTSDGTNWTSAPAAAGGGIVDADHGGTDLTTADLVGQAGAALVVANDELGYAFKQMPSGEVAGTSATQTLTNKTINATANTISNIANTNVSATAAIAGTKISPDFGSQNVVTTGYGAFGGSTLPVTGTIRLPAGATIKSVVGGVDRTFVELSTGAEIIIGTFAEVTSIIHRIQTGGSIYNQIAGSNFLTINANQIRLGSPLAGDSSGSLPCRFKSAAITQSSTTATTLTAAQYECLILAVSGTPGGNFDVIAPNTSDSVFWVRNTTANTLTIKKSGGTGVAIATNKAAMVWHNGTDYVRLTPDA